MEEIEKELHELKEKLQKKQELRRQEKESQQEQVQQGAQLVQTDETSPVEVVDSSEQLALGRHGELLQEQDFTQNIEQTLEQMDTNIEQQELEKEIELMPHHQEVDPLASPCPEEEQVASDQGDTEILGDNPEEEMHNISFDESQHRDVQSHRVLTLDDHTSPTHFEERTTMSDVCKHLATLADATRAYVEATSSSVRFLIYENKKMAKELQTAKQGGELVTASARAELKKEILDEVLSLDTIMQALYSKFSTMHKVVIHLNGVAAAMCQESTYLVKRACFC